MSGAYNELLENSPGAMFTHSLKFKKLIKRIIPDAQENYLCLFDGSELVATIPTFIKNGSYGPVINSLPFYGSHGGFVASKNVDPKKLQLLSDAYVEFVKETEAFSSTIIESPLDQGQLGLPKLSCDRHDFRIGQVKRLAHFKTHEDLNHALLCSLHQKTRNMVRKGMKGGFEIAHGLSDEIVTTLHRIHEENILAVKGIPKPIELFFAITEVYEYDKDYRFYVAWRGREVVSAILIFYFKNMVEYFCPVIKDQYRSEQPLSSLIFAAMKDCIEERGSEIWNWGGTWLSQDGVYRFKKRWGSEDIPYKYYVSLREDFDSSTLKKNTLLHDYKFFYTIPFDEL